MAKVLLVDDSDSLREQVKKDLEKAGHTVLEGADGLKGYEALKTNPDIQLVISDINMPNMDGIELLSNIKANPSYKTVPVLMVTTEGSQAKVMQALELGAVGYVRKPFTAEEIKGKLTGII